MQNECLKVTRVSITLTTFPNFPTDLKAFAEVELNDQLILRDIRINGAIDNLWIGYPIDLFYKGEDYRSIFFPATKELRDEIENAVIEAYKKEINNGKDTTPNDD